MSGSPAQEEPVAAAMEPSELERMIAESIQRIFSQHVSPAVIDGTEAGQWPVELWQIIEDSGLPLALCRGDDGGSEARWTDIYPVFTAIGHWNVPVPLAETIIAAGLLNRAGVTVPSGPIAIVPASPRLTMTNRSGQLACSGALTAVPWGRRRPWLLTAVDASNARLALVDLSGRASMMRMSVNMAGEPRDDLQLNDVPVETVFANPFPTLLNPLLQLGALTRCAMVVGALERTLQLTVQHVNERVQFGRPIGKNQVIQHGLASAAGEMVAAKVATRIAFFSLQDRRVPTADFDIAVAKICCGRAAIRLATAAHQYHGAIGFTHEHMLHRSTRRLWSWRDEFGSDSTWAAALGRAAIAKGGRGFWPALTDRSLTPTSPLFLT